MPTAINRRAILAGAAALPAISIPALAGADAELIAIGEKMKPLFQLWAEAMAKSHEEHERTVELAGWNDEGYMQAARNRPIAEHQARFDTAREKTGYRAAFARAMELEKQIWPLAEAAMEHEATTPAGCGTLAAAALVLDHYAFDSAVNAKSALISMAQVAGFPGAAN